MPNIRIVQNSTTVNGDAATSTIQTGILVGSVCTLSIQGVTPASYTWTLGVPVGSDDELSSTTTASPTFTPTVAGNYFITLNGTYTLPISVTISVPNVYEGPVVPASLQPSQVTVPAEGVSIISDSTKPGSLLSTDTNGNQAPIAIVRSGVTGSRPNGSTIGLYVGFTYFDTTLVKPIWYTGSGWIDATGAGV